MKKGTVITLSLSHKSLNHIFRDGDPVKENEVDNFDLLVKKGFIEPDAETKKLYKAKETEAKKAEADLKKKNTEAVAKKAEHAKEKTDKVKNKPDKVK